MKFPTHKVNPLNAEAYPFTVTKYYFYSQKMGPFISEVCWYVFFENELIGEAVTLEVQSTSPNPHNYCVDAWVHHTSFPCCYLVQQKSGEIYSGLFTCLKRLGVKP